MSGLPKLRPALELLGDALWVRPLFAVLAGLALGGALPDVEIGEGALLWEGEPSGARDFLLTLISTTLTVTATVFGFIIVALQLASTQFSPRSLRSFVRDRGTQSALAVLLGVVAYAVGVLVRIDDGGQAGPVLAMTIAVGLVVVVALALVFLIHHTAQSIRIEHLMASITEDTLATLARRWASMDATGAPTDTIPDRPVDACELPATQSGYIEEIDVDALAALAQEHDVVLVLRSRVGQHVIERLPIAWAWRRDGGRVPEDVRARLTEGVGNGVSAGVERTMEQDVAFGSRQLVDIALRAISPAINDPRTAVEATKHLGRILCALARRPLRPQVRLDGDGALQVFVPELDFDGHLGLACDQIRRFGAGEPGVCTGLLDLLEDVALSEPSEERRRSVLRHVELVEDAARREVAQPADLAAVQRRAEEVRAVVHGERPTPGKPAHREPGA